MCDGGDDVYDGCHGDDVLMRCYGYHVSYYDCGCYGDDLGGCGGCCHGGEPPEIDRKIVRKKEEQEGRRI